MEISRSDINNLTGGIDMKIVYLKPGSSFRDNLRSDSLWGLICWGIKTLYSDEELNSFISGYSSGYPLKISSAFKYVEDQKVRIRFFPKPMLPPFDFQQMLEGKKKSEKMEIFKKLKDWKSQKMVSEAVFFRFLSGELNEKGFFGSSELWNAALLSKNFKEEAEIHNSINRLTGSTNPVLSEDGKEIGKTGGLFSRDEIFTQTGGLFFLMDGEDKYLKMAEAVLRYYSHTGLMGDSSTGKNHFEITVEDFRFPEVKDSNSFVSLSLYLPKEEETTFYQSESSSCFYELETRKGKISTGHLNQTDFWKDSVLSFKEGSVFKSTSKSGYGTIKKVKEITGEKSFSVYHYGAAFDIPARIL
jgi:CRISPR-associated protein Csm4